MGVACDKGAGQAMPAAPAIDHLQALARFRHHVRRFFAESDRLTAAMGVSQTQYQAMLALAAQPDGAPMTISALADHLFIKLNTAAELVQRLEQANLIERHRSDSDRRSSWLSLSEKGRAAVGPIAAMHLAEHRGRLDELRRIVADLAE